MSPIRVVLAEEVHVSVLKALMMVGLGRERVIKVPVDGQGWMNPEALPALDEQSLQAGNVNTGSFDPASAIIHQAKAASAWVHDVVLN